MDIVPYKERCFFCRKRKFTKLCDFVIGYVVSSIGFERRAITCDQHMCDECAKELAEEFHFCPEHVEVTKQKLGMKQS